MKRLRLLWRVMRTTHSDALLAFLLVFVAVIALLLTLFEPQMPTHGDALWYCFSVITTIGFGDISAVTFAGRLLSIVLGLFGILVISIVVGVFVAYYNEFARMRHDESLEMFANKLEHLPALSPEELAHLSEQVKRARRGAAGGDSRPSRKPF